MVPETARSTESTTFRVGSDRIFYRCSSNGMHVWYYLFFDFAPFIVTLGRAYKDYIATSDDIAYKEKAEIDS